MYIEVSGVIRDVLMNVRRNLKLEDHSVLTRTCFIAMMVSRGIDN